MTNSDVLSLRALENIESCSDPVKLRRIADNARGLRNETVRLAALRRLYAVSPEAQPGTLEHDVWQSIFALEGELSDERGKTIRLSRTRQKIQRDGEAGTVTDLIQKPPSDGFRMLLDRGMLDLTFEAVALRHPDRFTPTVLKSAALRLESARGSTAGCGG